MHLEPSGQRGLSLDTQSPSKRGLSFLPLGQGAEITQVICIYTHLKEPEEPPVLEGRPGPSDEASPVAPKPKLVVPSRKVGKQPAPLDERPPPPHPDSAARRRIRSKSTVSAIKGVRQHERKVLVDRILQHPDFAKLGAGSRKAVKANGEFKHSTFGAYQHGNQLGITNACDAHSEFCQLVCDLVRLDHPEYAFTSITVSCNAKMNLHRDQFNDPSTFNLMSPLKVLPEGEGDVWVEVKVGDLLGSCRVPSREVQGKQTLGL